MPTPRATDEKHSLAELLKKLAAEGLEVARAELDLARAEAACVTKHYIIGASICVGCFVVANAAVVILSQAAALSLEPYFSTPAKAYLMTGLAMSLITIFMGWLGVTFLTRKFHPVGIIFKWLSGQSRTS